MASTSVHFPKGLLEEIERRAAESGVSRNRFIVDSCRRSLDAGHRRWPQGFFSNTHLSRAALQELRDSAGEFERSLHDGRRTRRASPF